MSISTILETNILSIYSNAVKAFPLKLSMRISKFSPETTHILCIFFVLVCMIPFLFSVFVFNFSGVVPSKPTLKNFISHLLKKQIVLSKHDIKLKILRFSIVNSAAFVFQQLLFKSNQLWLFHRF